MRSIVFYIAATGEIDSVAEYEDGTEDADITADQPAGCVWIEGDADPTTDYVPAGAITERPDFGAQDLYEIDADGVEHTLFTMPDSTVVTYRGDEFIGGDAYFAIDDDAGGSVLGAGDDYLVFSSGDTDFVFSATRSGEFEFRIQPPFPYVPTVVTVIANVV